MAKNTKTPQTEQFNPADLNTDQLSPHSVEAEEAVLGSILISPDVLPLVRQVITKPEDFFIVRSAWIYEAMCAIADRKDPVDYLTVVSQLEETAKLAEVGGAAYILSLINKTPSALNVEGYAHIVERMAIRRELIDAASQIARVAHSEETDIDEVMNKSDRALQSVKTRRTRIEVFSMSEVGDKSYDRQVMISGFDEGQSLAIPTGFLQIDRVTDHQLQFGKFAGIIGETRHGKSTVAAQIAANMIESVDWILFCSIEMTPINLHDRIVCARAGVPFTLYMENGLTHDQLYKFNTEAGWLKRQEHFKVVGKKVAPYHVRRFADTLAQQYGAPGVIFIDTVNKMKGVKSEHGRYEGLTNVSEELDAIKLDGHLLIGLFQHKINREGTKKAAELRPTLESMKESGGPVQDVDVLFSIYNADHYRRKFGPGWDDSHCPPGMIMSEALKLRDGNPNITPALLAFEQGIPRVVDTTSTNVDLNDKSNWEREEAPDPLDGLYDRN